MSSKKDRDGPGKKRKGPRRIETQRAAPRREERDTRPAFTYGNGLDHEGQTPPLDPTGNPKCKCENRSPGTLPHDTGWMTGAYFARTRLVVIGGLDDGRRYHWVGLELAHLRQKERRQEDNPEDDGPDGFPPSAPAAGPIPRSPKGSLGGTNVADPARAAS